MSGTVGEEPTLWIGAEGVIEAANDAALALLGRSLDELRALPQGSLAADPTDPDEQTALREQWQAAGRSGIAGITTIKRPGGARVRVAFAIARQTNGSYVASLNALPGSKASRTRVYTVGDVLGRWRAAERRLETIAIGSPEYEEIRDEIDVLRAQYGRLFDARTQAS